MSVKQSKFNPINPELDELVQKHHRNPEALVDILMERQAQRGGVTPTDITDIARALKIPPSSAFGIASFYSMINLQTIPAKFSEHEISVCDGPVCWLAGSLELQKKIKGLLAENTDWRVTRTSCLGLCDRAPAALVDNNQVGPIGADSYHRLLNGWNGARHSYSSPLSGEVRVMLDKAGKIDPGSIESALIHDAYCGLSKTLTREPESVIQEILQSGLTGRGGAGFLVGKKWGFVAENKKQPKYIICNADESEPLIFKDRILIETNPHQVLEGMAIAGYATGAQHGIIYIRGEYKKQARLLERAISQARIAGWLGTNIQERNFDFDIHVHKGAGAYICGEETALIESLEGFRGEPRLRPPYPPTYGYKGLPTLVNNVESFAAVPAIMCNGASWYQSLSDWRTAGTKIYMVLGHVNRPGLFEAPFGVTLRQIINDFGGGMKDGSSFHFALTGGAAGTIVSDRYLDVRIDFASTADGVSIGAGAFLICDQTVSPVDLLKVVMHFFRVESCGKCTPCRNGTRRALEILDRLSEKKGASNDLEELSRLAQVMRTTSICGLGQSVSIPVNSALNNFKAEFNTALLT